MGYDDQPENLTLTLTPTLTLIRWATTTSQRSYRRPYRPSTSERTRASATWTASRWWRCSSCLRSNPTHPRLQPHATQAATPCHPGCSPTQPRLQPHATQAAASRTQAATPCTQAAALLIRAAPLCNPGADLFQQPLPRARASRPDEPSQAAPPHGQSTSRPLA